MAIPQQPTRRIAVVGAGITGLAAAHRLTRRLSHAHIDVLELSDRAGGTIRTEYRDSFLIEHGPDAFITNKPGAVELCDELGYSDQLIGTDERYRRSLVVRKGKPLPIPEGFMLMAPSRPSAVITSPVLSIPGRLRLLAEALKPRRRDDGDESVAAFVRRRFGKEALDRLVQPLVGGIYTSDPEKLSLLATLPRFRQMEQEYGSVIRAAVAGRSDTSAHGSGARYGLFATPATGLQGLIDRLTETLRATERVDLKLSTRVLEIEPNDTSCGWGLSLESLSTGMTAHVDYDAVLLATPVFLSARLLHSVGGGKLSDALNTIEYASSAIVTTGHRLSDFDHPLDAFGIVVPATENRKVLAISFASRKFAGRAPDDHVLLRTFVGGALQPEMLERDDDELSKIVTEELRALLGLHASPLFSDVARHDSAMPQYHVGHLDRVAAIEELAASLPQLELAGSAFRGVGLPDCISNARHAADRLADSAG